MPVHPTVFSSRLRGLISATIVAVLLLSGCSGGGGEKDSDSASDGFTPVRIKHALGTAVVKHKPKRIVTLGQGSTETAIALGTVPVGMEDYPWGSDDSGYLPWVREAVKKRDAKLPKKLTGAKDLDVEAVLALKPDLILAPWSGLTQKQYDMLSDAAPTVAYDKEPWVTTWQRQIRVIAQAMGQKDDGEKLISDIHSQFKSAARKEYKDLTFSYLYNDGPGSLGMFFPNEQRVAMLRALGLKVDPVVNKLRKYEVKGTDSASISLERADELKNSDLIFTFYSDEKNRKEVEAQSLYKNIPAIKRGSLVAPTDQPFVTGSSMINPLTVPWTLKRYAPMIDRAVAKVP